MKCDRCGKNEATFHYKTNINGRVTEAHLCPDCAQAMGYAGSVERRMSSWFDDDWFDRPFRMLEPFFGGFGSRMLTEFPQPVDVLEQAQSADPPRSCCRRTRLCLWRWSVGATRWRRSCTTRWRRSVMRTPPACVMS